MIQQKKTNFINNWINVNIDNVEVSSKYIKFIS